MSWIITGTEKNPVDPYFSNVSLLLHGDGTNGSTTIVDSSPTPKTVTAYGNAQISTAVADPFGNSTGVLAFDGSGDYLTLLGGSAFEFGTGDFTVELWYRPGLLTGLRILIDTRGAGQPSIADRWIVLTDGSSLQVALANTSYTNGTLLLNTWHFISVSRVSGVTRVFLDGTQVGSNISDTSNYGVGAARPIIGADGNNPASLNLNGYIDDLRITKGVARYETGTGANAGKMVFTGTNTLALPTAPFPDF